MLQQAHSAVASHTTGQQSQQQVQQQQQQQQAGCASSGWQPLSELLAPRQASKHSSCLAVHCLAQLSTSVAQATHAVCCWLLSHIGSGAWLGHRHPPAAAAASTASGGPSAAAAAANHRQSQQLQPLQPGWQLQVLVQHLLGLLVGLNLLLHREVLLEAAAGAAANLADNVLEPHIQWLMAAHPGGESWR